MGAHGTKGCLARVFMIVFVAFSMNVAYNIAYTLKIGRRSRGLQPHLFPKQGLSYACRVQAPLCATSGPQTTNSPTSISKPVLNRNLAKLGFLISLSSLGGMLSRSPRAARAIGELTETKRTNMVLQDVAFNVKNTAIEESVLRAVTQGSWRTLRTSREDGLNTTVMAFGPDALKSPTTFIPGVSTFFEDGGHSTLTLRAREFDDGRAEIADEGNGLQFIKVGTDVLRLSKGVAMGEKALYLQ